MCLLLLATVATVAAPGSAARIARAADPASNGDSPNSAVTTLGLDPAMSLDPSAPQVGALPGGVSPAYGRKSVKEGDWRFDFHGFLTAPLNVGFNTREMPLPGQEKNVLHAPPVVPDDLETFSHTGVVPTTYARLNFSQGNGLVSANMSLVARQANASTSFLEPASQQGVTDLFVALTPAPYRNMRAQFLVGAFSSRYGSTGEYDEGRYGTPLIARVNGMGEQASLKAIWGDFTLMVEQGLQGQSNKPGSSIIPDVSSDFADPGAGSSFASHLHVGVGFRRWGTLGGHYIRAWSQDDRAGNLALDGGLDISAADIRLTLGRFGHLYVAFARTQAENARTVSRMISVLNTKGGLGLMDNYLGRLSNGTGTLTTVGGQYDLSIGKLVSYPTPFYGDGPDLFVSVFGMQTHVSSADRTADNITMRKIGIEGTYSLLSWLAVSTRYDQVAPHVGMDDLSFAVLAPRLIFRSDWAATDQVVLQYAHWFNGSRTTVRVGDPPVPDPTVIPDSGVLSLSATMWW
ncbi:MAG: hypothetical protein H7X95_02405 [Deltaproteobacteria bacterium]|nr:hypothetical protein [Deltaproteobacteria bacterium]